MTIRTKTDENPRWTACRHYLGREPSAFEFLIWNGARVGEWVRLKGGRTNDDRRWFIGMYGSEYDKWLLDTANAEPQWHTVM